MVDKIHVAIGTQNHAKVEAVKKSFDFFFPNVIKEYHSVNVNSEVGDQPIGLDDTINGAINRAKNAFNMTFNKIINNNDLHLGIGIEAGMIPIKQTETGYLDFQFTAIYQQNKRISLGCGSAFEYPSIIIKEILNGNAKEIGDVIEKISGIKDIKKKEGAIGLLTNNRLIRADILSQGILMALLPIINKKLYDKK
ncbi:MAG: inosine/xanthosine triphosphatase [archaeon]|nr:inosine/xanthosine triphosphatase [archaeon]